MLGLSGAYDIRCDDRSTVRGLVRGVVEKLCVENKINKAIVKLVYEGAKGVNTVPADVLATFAGNKFGTVFIPKVGEEVLIGFLNGNINEPIILGSLYNSKNLPPLSIDAQKNEVMFIKFPAGMTIEINNKSKNQQVVIKTEKGHQVILDDGSKERVFIKDKNAKTSLNVNFKSGSIAMEAEKEFSVKVGQSKLFMNGNKFTVTSTQCDLKAKSKMAVSGQSTNIDGTNMNLKSKAVVNIKSNGVASLKGTINKIG